MAEGRGKTWRPGETGGTRGVSGLCWALFHKGLDWPLGSLSLSFLSLTLTLDLSLSLFGAALFFPLSASVSSPHSLSFLHPVVATGIQGCRIAPFKASSHFLCTIAILSPLIFYPHSSSILNAITALTAPEAGRLKSSKSE